jgi:hypothetical protein
VAGLDGKLYPTDGGAPRPIPGFEPGDVVVRWAAEPGTLFVRHKMDSGDEQVFRLDPAGRRTLAVQIARPSGTVMGRWFSITPDGSAYAITYAVSQSDLFRVTGLK